MALGARGDRVKDRDGWTRFETEELWGLHTSFGETLVAQRTPVINVTRIDAFQDIIDEQNGAAVNNDRRSISTGTNGGGRVVVVSKERPQYQDGTVGEWAQFKQVSRELSGGEFVEYIGGDGNNQFGWRFDSGGPSIFIDDEGTRESIAQEDWNRDTLTGKGGKKNRSGLKLDATTRDVLYNHLIWYGGGPLQWWAHMQRDSRRFWVKVHEQNLDDNVDLIDPNQNLRTVVDNGGETDGFTVKVRGRQTSILGGRLRTTTRDVQEFVLRRAIATTSWVPIMSMRKKAIYPPNSGLTNTTRGRLLAFEPSTDAPALTRTTFDDTIGNPGNEAFTSPTGWGDQSAIEVDKGPGDLGLTAGYPAPYELFESAGTTGSAGVVKGSETERIGAPIGDDTVVTFWARKIASGDNDPNVSFTVSWLEDQ